MPDPQIIDLITIGVFFGAFVLFFLARRRGR